MNGNGKGMVLRDIPVLGETSKQEGLSLELASSFSGQRLALGGHPGQECFGHIIMVMLK